MEEIEIIDVVEAPAWGDLYLKFASEEEAIAALEGYPGSIDVIGVIWKPSGEVAVDADGNEVPVMTSLDGWHVNTRGPMLFDLLPFAVNPEPTTPVRVWA